MKILLVDDDEDMRIMIAEMLGGLYDVQGCSDAKEALVALDADGFDLLIADVVMPSMSGIELSNMIKQRGNKMPVLVMSGKYTGGESNMEFASYFSEDTLAKPFTKEALIAKIENLLGNKGALSFYG